MAPVTPFVGVHCSDPAVPVTLQLELAAPAITAADAGSAELLAYRPESGWRTLSDQHFNAEAGAMNGSDTQPGVYVVLRRGGAPATPAAAVAETPPALPPAATPPAEPAPAGNATPAPPVVPPSSDARKPTLAWGKTLELRAENQRAEFRLDADASVGAFTKVLPEPPAALPEGLQPYSAAVALSLSKRDVPVRITIVMHPEGEIPRGTDPASLALYAHHADSGWTRIEPQQFDPATRAFTAPDNQPRTYILLGPQSP